MKSKFLVVVAFFVLFGLAIVGVSAADPGLCYMSFDGYGVANNCHCNLGNPPTLMFTSSTFGECVDICASQYSCQYYSFSHVWGPETSPESWTWTIYSGSWTRAELNVIFWGMFFYDSVVCGGDTPAP